MRGFAPLAALFLATLGCVEGRQVWVAPSLVPALEQYESALLEERSSLRLAGGAARNCEQYSNGGRAHEGGANQLVRSEYLICDVLLQLGPKRRVSPLPDGEFGRALAERLDLRSFPSSLGPRVNERSHTVATLFATGVEVYAHRASAETSDWSFQLELVALADVDGTGERDWIVWVIDEALAGTYRGYSTLVLRDPPQNGPIVAELLR